MLRAVTGYLFVCTSIIGLPTIYHYRPPGTWMDRMGMIAEGRYGYITEPWFQIAMTVVALTGALGLILLFAGRKASRAKEVAVAMPAPVVADDHHGH